ncbi:hypothetical protein [Sorangium sp. So ce861]|uniref:hypothetical protein n=1 Tax=Sorangium sp. So ce861 TaxID=3133323 RepID=UPI003F630D6B
MGCPSTVFHAAQQSAAHLVPKLAKGGVRRFRIELVREDAEGADRLPLPGTWLISHPAAHAAAKARLPSAARDGAPRGEARPPRRALAPTGAR